MKVEKKAKQPIEYDFIYTMSAEEKALIMYLVKAGLRAQREQASRYAPGGDGAMCVALLSDDIYSEYGDPSDPIRTHQAMFGAEKGGYRDSLNVRNVLRALGIFE